MFVSVVFPEPIFPAIAMCILVFFRKDSTKMRLCEGKGKKIFRFGGREHFSGVGYFHALCRPLPNGKKYFSRFSRLFAFLSLLLRR
jgi:hypothetical protein